MKQFHARFFVVLTLAVMALGSILPRSGYADEERMAGTPPAVTDEDSDYRDIYRQLNLFGDVFERVREEYVEETPDKELVEHAINGMLTSLDPHSSYLNEDDFKDMQVQTRGEFGGLGIEVTMDNGLVKVVSPIDDTPAYRAGVKAGDYITHLDDEAVMGLTLNEAVDKMRGKIGTTIHLTIRREGASEPVEVDITRDIIKIRSVRHKMVDGDIGYIRITTFNQNTDSGLRKAVKEFKQEAGESLAGYIIDLRNNPGGLLDQAIAVSDDFLDKGEIVSTRGRSADNTERENATPGDIADGLPIVVLVNGGSASASEIVAGALQDHRRAIILGTQTFGKGSVQTVIPLPGHGAMRLTTARYYTPSGRSIQAKGIEPDITVELAKIESYDIQGYRESDLRGALDNPDKDDKDSDKTADKTKAKAKEKPKAKDSSKSDKDDKADSSAEDESREDDIIKADEVEDYQLSRAIDLIRGVSLYGTLQFEKESPVPPASESESSTEEQE